MADEIHRKRFLLPNKETVTRQVIRNYKRNAKSRNIEYSLDKKDVKELIFKKCYYCGSEPNNVHIFHGRNTENDPYFYSGIDRIDNSKGYIKDNCISCCYNCNYMKGHMNVNDFIEHVQKILEWITKGM